MRFIIGTCLVFGGSLVAWGCGAGSSESASDEPSAGLEPDLPIGIGAGTGGAANAPNPGSHVGAGGMSAGAGGASAAGSGAIAAPPVIGPAADGGASEPPLEPEVPPVVNPFTVVAHDPLSTFAADVDTASYDLFSRTVSSGYLPEPGTVRTEEFVNYFAYDYPAPSLDAAEPFSITLGAAPGFFSDGTTILRVGIQAKHPPPFQKKPTNLVFLVDVSGSMQSSDKLPLVQHVLTHTLDVLDATDRVSIVSYAGDTAVRLQPTAVAQRTLIQGAIDGLHSAGSTNGAGGIQLAYEQAAAGFIEGGINHVILCTDGDFNVGISDTTALVDLIEEKRRTGVTLTALGFGASPNDYMMNAVSNAGNGIYGIITDQPQADRYVEERMLSTLVHVARDVKIQVEFNPEAVLAYRLLGYETRAIADSDFRDDKVDAGEIGAGHRVTALYQVIGAGGALPGDSPDLPIADGAPYDGPVEVSAGDMVLVKVRYKQPDALETDPASEVAVSLSSSQAWADLAQADTDMRWAVAVGTFSELLRGSPYVTPQVLGPIELILDQTRGDDRDRAAFLALYRSARPMMLAR